MVTGHACFCARHEQSFPLEFRNDPLRLVQRAREYGAVVRIRFGPFCVCVFLI